MDGAADAEAERAREIRDRDLAEVVALDEGEDGLVAARAGVGEQVELGARPRPPGSTVAIHQQREARRELAEAFEHELAALLVDRRGGEARPRLGVVDPERESAVAPWSGEDRR